MTTITIIDWDDTLFPTSWVMLNKIPIKKNDIFDKLDKLIYNFLSTINGIIYIVTNAMIKWVQLSLSVLPKTADFINNNTSVISAKEKYEGQTRNIMDWKKFTFKEIANNHVLNNIKNIISIGDAEYEFVALTDLFYSNTNKKYKTFLKTIRLIPKPNIDIICDQLVTLTSTIHGCINNNRHLDLIFRKKT